MLRFTWLLLLTASCAADTDTGRDGGASASEPAAVTRTICRGVATSTSERPRCDVPNIGPDNPPQITCWVQHSGAWTSEPREGIELVAGAVYCPVTYTGDSWAIVVMSAH